jgi:hypothetical protein
MLVEGLNPPDYLRRGIRLALGLGLAAFFGYVILTPGKRSCRVVSLNCS